MIFKDFPSEKNINLFLKIFLKRFYKYNFCLVLFVIYLEQSTGKSKII